MTDFGGARAPIAHLHPRAHYAYRLATQPLGGRSKRLFDIAAASCALAVLSPLLLIVAVLVRLDSPGPSLFRQARTGFRGRAFSILKFRTMAQCDGRGRTEQARRHDPRVTRLGRFLRRTSIDELPQLINVVRGDMSLVGPRPHAVDHDRRFFAINARYPRRFLARPGITGAAQVAGARGLIETPEQLEARLRMDLEYLDEWSWVRDFRIILATVRVLLHDRSAF